MLNEAHAEKKPKQKIKQKQKKKNKSVIQKSIFIDHLDEMELNCL